MVRWTEDQKKRYAALLEERFASQPCPRCGYAYFALLDGFIHLPVSSGRGAEPVENVLPALVAICQRCGFLSQHALSVLGIATQDDTLTGNQLGFRESIATGTHNVARLTNIRGDIRTSVADILHGMWSAQKMPLPIDSSAIRDVLTLRLGRQIEPGELRAVLDYFEDSGCIRAAKYLDATGVAEHGAMVITWVDLNCLEPLRP